MSDSDYSVRAYVEGDETSLLKLFDQYFGHYAGFVPRTLQEWLWFCKLHPFIGPERISVACKGEQIVGYSATGIMSQRDGYQVYELCYDRNYDGEVIVSKLLEKIEQYVRGHGGSYINYDPPSDDILACRICDELGFVQYPRDEVLGFVILDITKLVEHIVKGKPQAWNMGNEIFLIRLKDLPFPNNVISIKWNQGELSFSNTVPSDETGIAINTDSPTLSRLILGGESILKAMLKSGLTIKPIWKIRKGIMLLSLLCLRDRWYIPRRGIEQ